MKDTRNDNYELCPCLMDLGVLLCSSFSVIRVNLLVVSEKREDQVATKKQTSKPTSAHTVHSVCFFQQNVQTAYRIHSNEQSSLAHCFYLSLFSDLL